MKIMHLISRWNERKTFCLRIMRLGKIIDYTFCFIIFGPTLNQRRGIQKQNTTIQTISKNYNSTKKLFLKNYNHGSSIVDRQFLASSPF